MVDNFEQIRNLLKFRSDDDFYFLQIIQRKKDHNTNINGSNNNSRLIKAYYVKSLEQFDFLKDEIIKLCEVFNARAGINLNRRSFKKMHLHHIKKLTDQMMNDVYNRSHRAYNHVCGIYMNDSDKRWILDIDGDFDRRWLNEVIRFAETKCEPEGNKFVDIIPSKNGVHVIMKPFNKKKFSEAYKNIEIHRNNPTNLYIS